MCQLLFWYARKARPAIYDNQLLGEKSIRLLRIHSELRNCRISCILNHYNDNDNIPPYDALSYYWGNPKPTRLIYVNGSLVGIHEALWEFLNQMQRSQQTENWIWTDFLCLDQSNEAEKRHQIPRMGRIYSEAERTISWLGCKHSSWVAHSYGSSTLSEFLKSSVSFFSVAPSHDSSTLLEGLEKDLGSIAEIVAAKRAAVETFFAQPGMPRWTNVSRFMLGDRYPLGVQVPSGSEAPIDRKDFPKAVNEVQLLSIGPAAQGLLNILSLPYWRRAWITQEVALATQVILMFGGTTLDFDDLFLTYKSYSYYYMSKFQGIPELRIPIEARAAVLENNVSFQQIFQWGQCCEASKTVDRIYGLLGLLQHSDGGTKTLPPILTQRIDYTRDWREIYWEIVFTYNPLKDASIMGPKAYLEAMKRWVNILSRLARSLSCPFTRESLGYYADNERATHWCNKACLAIRLVDICKSACMTDTDMRILRPDALSWNAWPNKDRTRQFWFTSLDAAEFDLQRLLGSLLVETTGIQGIDEDDEYHATYIGLRMARLGREEAVWSCIPQGPPVHNNLNKRSFSCAIWPASSQLPCSSHLTESSAEPLQESHQCQTKDRYLVIQETGWRLSLEDLYYSGEGNRWLGTLNIEYSMSSSRDDSEPLVAGLTAIERPLQQRA